MADLKLYNVTGESVSYSGITQIVIPNATSGSTTFTDTSDANAVAGDILSGKTAYINGSKITGNITSQAAQTITPGTADQTISAGKYLSGIQTIKGDANLVAANIKSGVSIFGVTGNMSDGAAELNSISIRTQPTNKVYSIGETFDPAGMEVIANYTVGEDIISNVLITNYTYTNTTLAAGDNTITISYTFNGTTKTATTTVKAFTVGATLNDTSWATISQIAQAGVGDYFWDIGDCKAITLNGQVGDTTGGRTYSNTTLYVFILDFNHIDEVTYNDSDEEAIKYNNIIFGGFKSALTNGIDLCLDGAVYNSSKTDGTLCFNMNHQGNYNYGGWKGCDLRYDILGSTETAPSNYGSAKTTSTVGYDATKTAITSPKENTLMAALPSDFRSVLRLWKSKINNTGNSGDTASKVTDVIDTIRLLTETEIVGGKAYANTAEQIYQNIMTYYKNGNSHIKYRQSSTSSAAYWWLASPYYGNSSTFCTVSYDGYANRNNAYYSYGVAPAFKI